MKLFNYLILFILLVASCKEDDVDTVFYENYGEGMYVITDIGISFCSYEDSIAKITNQIYTLVNNLSVSNARKMKFRGGKAYILSDKSIIVTDVHTFEYIGEINGFLNPVDFDFIEPNSRLFVADKDDSNIKVVDLESMQIISDIETGDSTYPNFILSNSTRSFVLNGGGLSSESKDSTVVVIEYRDNLVALANFIGSLSVGDNPNSAVITSSGALKVLCKGVYDPINSSNNTESSLSNMNQYSNIVYGTDNLSGIYNAQNLISNYDKSSCYLTADGGVYRLNPDNLNLNLLVSVNSSVINTRVESFAINDTTTVFYEMLYMNDIDSPNSIYKYNLALSTYVDTIIVNGNVRGISFY